VSIETKNDERGPLYRWACLVCVKRGMWIRGREQAVRGVHAHRGSRQHHLQVLRLAEKQPRADRGAS
jgi:hypothetical protein